MNNRLKTDFLCASSGFLMGFGSVLSLQGQVYEYNRSANADTIAISNDWRMVGKDISDSLKKAKADLLVPGKK